MISAAEYLRRVKTINKASILQDMAFKVIMEEEVAVLNLKEQDFTKGDIYGDDTRVRYQSQAYEAYKASLNPVAGGAVDLMLSHDFVDAMFIKRPNQNRYSFGNNNWKKEILESKYPRGIFGLNQNVFDQFQKDVLSPMFNKLIKDTAKIA